MYAAQLGTWTVDGRHSKPTQTVNLSIIQMDEARSIDFQLHRI